MTNVVGQRMEPTGEAAFSLIDHAGVRRAAAVDLAIWPGGHGDGGRPVRLFA
jgi:hypothetical protein